MSERTKKPKNQALKPTKMVIANTTAKPFFGMLDKNYNSLTILKQQTTYIMRKYISPKTGLVMLTPAKFLKLIGITTQKYKSFQNSQDPKIIAYYSFLEEAKTFLMAEMEQSLLQDVNNAYSRIKILQAHSPAWSETLKIVTDSNVSPIINLGDVKKTYSFKTEKN